MDKKINKKWPLCYWRRRTASGTLFGTHQKTFFLLNQLVLLHPACGVAKEARTMLLGIHGNRRAEGRSLTFRPGEAEAARSA